MGFLLEGGDVLTVRGLERADVLIEADRIVEVGSDLSPRPGTERLMACKRLIVPGLVNGHTHSHNTLSRGLAGRWTLEDQLNYGLALLAGRTAEEHYVSAALTAIELLRTGCTTACDLFMALPSPTDEDIEAVICAYADVGLRVLVAPALADLVFHSTLPGLLDLLPDQLRHSLRAFRARPAESLLALSERAIRRWDGTAAGRIRLAVSPTIPGQCSDEFLAGCARVAHQHDVPLHTHLAETQVQVAHARKRWGSTIVEHLAHIGLLGRNFAGAHGVWLTTRDIEFLAGAGARVVHNPASNLRLGSGVAPVREMLARSLEVGLGTDGSLSSDNQNMYESMRLAALVSRIPYPYRQEAWLDATETFRLATVGSAAAVGLAKQIGAVAPDCKADLVLLRADSAFLQPRTNVMNSLVFAETGMSVETAIVDGRLVLADGVICGVDEPALREQAQVAVERLAQANAERWEIARRLEPFVRAACTAAVTDLNALRSPGQNSDA